MLNRIAVVGTLAVALIGASALSGADEIDKQENTLKGIKCLFCKMDVSKDAFAEYKGARVYFGCAGCPEAFKRNEEKFATKANAQLVATKQARQKACPVSGKPHKDEFKLAVGKAQVAFCCTNCKEATEKLAGNAQLEKLFSDAAFKSAFRIPKVKKPK